MNTWIRISCCAICLVLGQPLLSQQARAEGDDEAALVAIIEAVAKGWEQADGTPFREHFLDFEGARYVESGGQNSGLDDLVEHHVEPEGDALDSLTLAFTDIETNVEGDFAWVVTTVDVKATVKSDQREIHNRGYGTYLFRRVDGTWKIVHTHSSTRPVTIQASHEHSESHD